MLLPMQPVSLSRQRTHPSLQKIPCALPQSLSTPTSGQPRSAFRHHFPHSRASHKYNYPVRTLFPQLLLTSMFLRFIHISPKLHFTSHISPSAKNHSFSPVCYKSSSDVIIPGVLCMLGCFNRVQLCDPMDCSPPGSSVHGIL